MAGSRSYLLAPDLVTPKDDPVVIACFVILILGGNVLIPIMVLAAFVQRNHYSRSPIFMNFCIGWIAYSIAFSLSLYSDRWRGEEPIPWVCEAQSVLVYVVPVLVAATTNALIFELWMGVIGLPNRGSIDKGPRSSLPLRTFILITFPYFCAIFMGVAASLVAQARPELVGFRAIFCSVDFQPLRMTISIFCILAIAVGFALQFDIGRRLYRSTRFGKARRQDWRDTSLFIRMVIFLIILAIGVLAAGLAGTTNSLRYPRQVIQAAFPISVWLVFGTNPAIYKPDPKPAFIAKV